nr:uncharacterized protein LOC123493942 [Aegilops tauschii subsp. strangulata]
MASRLQSPPAEELAPNDLCTTRRTMGLGDLERRLQLAMVAYVGGANRGISPEFVLEALSAQLDIGPEWLSVYPFRPEDFLVVFGRPEHRNLMASKPSIDHLGRRIFFRPWNRQAHAVHSRFSYKVPSCLKASRRTLGTERWWKTCLAVLAWWTWWRRSQARFVISLLSSSRRGRQTPRPSRRCGGWLSLSLDCSSRWWSRRCCNTQDSHPFGISADFGEREEPWFLTGVASYDSGQSGITDSGSGFSAGNGAGIVPQQRAWQFGVRDSRAGSSGAAMVEVQPRRRRPLWCLALAADGAEGDDLGGGAPLAVKDRLSVRISAFDRLSDKVGTAMPSGIQNHNDSMERGAVQLAVQDNVAVQEGATRTASGSSIPEPAVPPIASRELAPTAPPTAPVGTVVCSVGEPHAANPAAPRQLDADEDRRNPEGDTDMTNLPAPMLRS